MSAAELPGMLATLCSYESCFGPYHPQTLRLMTAIAVAYWQHGEIAYARPLLERLVRDLGRYLGRDHELRLQAIAVLRDLSIQQREYEKAGALQRELVEGRIQRLGSDHPETLASRADLAIILMSTVEHVSNKEV
jgi:hypothetical protein